MTAEVFDNRACTLGEGPLWHPERRQLFWFDIVAKQLLTRDDGESRLWQFDEHVSAAGWVDHDTLLLATETALIRFSISTGAHAPLVPLEADNPVTRSNDGRADPWGGFWVGTMGKAAEPGAGAIYRFHEGKVTKLFGGMTIPNAICFSPDRSTAYFTDTPTRRILRQHLDRAGWPDGPAETFVDLNADGFNPDGAVVDAAGCLWNAQWGAHRVARYSPEGAFLSAVLVPASQASCPAFGGDDLTSLFVTSARENPPDPAPEDGQTFVIDTAISGQPEHQVSL